jgi:hypothetical protein
MKNKVLYPAILFIAIIMSTPVYADPWQDYMAFLDKFYFLDNQNFETITCRVYAPSLDTSLSQLKALEKNVLIKENIRDFRAVYNKKDGLKLNVPEFDIKFKSDEGVKDRSKLESGISMVQAGMDKQISGLTRMITEVMEEYRLPRKDKIKDLSFKKEKDQVVVMYKTDDIESRDTYTGQTRKSVQKSPGASAEAEEKFTGIQDKLILESADSRFAYDKTNIKGILSLKVSYQTINKVVFPEKIQSSVSAEMPNLNQQAVVEVYFKDCKLE